MADMRTRQGEAITEEMLAGLAAEAEAGYDPATLRPRKTGRPSLGSGTSPRVQFRVSPAIYRQALECAEAEHRTLSDVARGLLEDYVRRAAQARDARPGGTVKPARRRPRA